MKKILLHIGSPKCGSSSIQSSLSSDDRLCRDQSTDIKYVAIRAEGKVLSGQEIVHARQVAPSRYIASFNIGKLLPDQYTAVISALKSILDNTDTLIFSCEGWLAQYDKINQSNIFQSLDCSVEAVCLVRPHCKLLNSAWWQWGAWDTSRTFDSWVRWYMQGINLAPKLTQWSSSNWIEKLHVLPLANAVDQIYELLELAPPKISSINKSLPGEILRLYQRHRQLRSAPHNPSSDFVLERQAIGDRPTPWVLSESQIEHVLQHTASDTENLLSFMTSPDQERVKSNPEWWSSKAYRDKIVEEPEPQAPSATEIDKIAARMAERLIALDIQNARLRAEKSNIQKENDMLKKARSALETENQTLKNTIAKNHQKRPGIWRFLAKL